MRNEKREILIQPGRRVETAWRGTLARREEGQTGSGNFKSFPKEMGIVSVNVKGREGLM